MTARTPHWTGLEIRPTLGEKVQNWLASKGFGQRVPKRDIEHPDPPLGLWVAVNGVITVTMMGLLVVGIWKSVSYLTLK